MMEASNFKEYVHQWLLEHCPISMRESAIGGQHVWGGRKQQFAHPDEKLWLERVREKGWLAPTWPKEYGGADLSEQDAKVIIREMQSLGCRPPLVSLGIHMMGPTIMEFGNEAQKKEHLPKIARGEIRWCQGYSEPGAGSDLASLKCKAELNGDNYVVTGQKVWTSFADKSDFLFCLVRTDFSATKHNGISVLLIDLDSPGVSIQPIELISGSSHFCEIFLDEVIVPKENLLGQLNKGWSIAKRMLEHERNMMGQGDLGDPFKPDLIALAKDYIGVESGKLNDAYLRDAIATNQIQHRALEATSNRILAEMKAGSMGAASSVMKYGLTLATQNTFELLLNVLGNKALGWQDEAHFSEMELRAAKEWAFSKVQTIGGGTSEVQLNIIAKHILGLPE